MILEEEERPNSGCFNSYRSNAIVKVLIAASADVNVANFGKTPLFWAVEKELAAIVKVLIAAGANVHVVYNNG